MYSARFLWHRVQNMLSPPGVSKVYILSALAKTSRQFGNFKAARYCYGQMKNLRIPKGPMWDEFQLGALSIRGKPYRDSEDFEILCPRCACSNSLINPAGDFCSNCQVRFLVLFLDFNHQISGAICLLVFQLRASSADRVLPRRRDRAGRSRTADGHCRF
jgi:hypothetical protein